jgi:hypothetical protein
LSEGAEKNHEKSVRIDGLQERFEPETTMMLSTCVFFKDTL